MPVQDVRSEPAYPFKDRGEKSPEPRLALLSAPLMSKKNLSPESTGRGEKAMLAEPVHLENGKGDAPVSVVPIFPGLPHSNP